MATGPLVAGIFLANTTSLSLQSGAVTLNNYSLLFILTACLFTAPHILRKKLRMKTETPTLQVLAIVTRPLINTLSPFLSIMRPDKK